MKKSLSFLIIFLLSLSAFPQPPQRMSYQCVVRDNGGALLVKQLVGMRTTILQGTDIQHVVYQETYNFTATNENGLLTIEIGSGKPTIVSGPFASIPWSSGPFYLQTEIDPAGGTNYTIVGKSQILSVPYALYAEESGSVTETDPVFGSSAARGITWTNFGNWNTAFEWGNHATAGYAAGLHLHDVNEIATGTLPVARGGTGLSSLIYKNYIRANGGTSFELRTPEQVLGDISGVSIYEDQLIGGEKTFLGKTSFTGTTTVETPVNASEVANKGYVDELLNTSNIANKEYIDELLTSLGIIPINFEGIITDIDHNNYKTVRIGTQVWMAENLSVTRYQNGDGIPIVTDQTTWMNLTSGAYCEYDNNNYNVSVYGRLYNWYAAADARNLCPTGWHLPSEEEWANLNYYLGNLLVSGGKLKESGTTHWLSPNTGASNESGFTALPGGDRSSGFQAIREYAGFWSSTQFDTENSIRFTLLYNSGASNWYHNAKYFGFSVRCIKD